LNDGDFGGRYWYGHTKKTLDSIEGRLDEERETKKKGRAGKDEVAQKVQRKGVRATLT